MTSERVCFLRHPQRSVRIQELLKEVHVFRCDGLSRERSEGVAYTSGKLRNQMEHLCMELRGGVQSPPFALGRVGPHKY